ncbi:MAG: DUF1295 domain-containing protein [Candidatus Paceibacterota bacterium]
MNLWFLVSLIKNKNDVADVAWGLGFVVLVWSSFLTTDSFNTRVLLINSLVSIWGLRLAAHIYQRNKGKEEDFRYQQWREDWGKWFYLRSYLQVFILQGLLLYAIALPALLVNKKLGTGLGWLDLAGFIVWLVGFFFEAVGDWQLTQFIKDPSKQGIMNEGLWRYTRHPNYFGEVTQWWGIFLIALSLPNSWFTVIGPLTITVLVVFVSGVPPVEEKMKEREDFQKYKKKTNKFFPGPVKD